MLETQGPGHQLLQLAGLLLLCQIAGSRAYSLGPFKIVPFSGKEGL